MIREFQLPDVGEGLTEAEIVAWHVDPGDAVSEDQVVAEVETDKAVVEVPAPVDGTVKAIHADPGDLVKVGEVIVTFEVADAAADPDEAPAASSDATVDGRTTEATGEPDEAAPVARGGRVFAAPSARRLARELGVDLATVAGSGPGGRVTESDVRAAAEPTEESTEEPSAEPTGSAPPGASGASRTRTLAAPATRQLARDLGVDVDRVPTDETRDGEPFVTPDAVRAFAERAPGEVAAATPAGAAVERVPYRGVRRSVGEQMVRSAYTAPHVTHHDEVDVTALVETRSRLRERAAERGSTLTYLPFVVRAVVAALAEYPYLNAELDEEAGEILLKRRYDVGIATATDAGLLVPVVERADEKSLLELADEIESLVGKARDRTIAREEMQGSTFTITNFGAIGGEYATPIINYPETAILGLGAIKEKPRVVDGEVVPRKVLTLSLSIDHRVVDGAVAARFVNAVKERLAAPDLLLLE
ncbi:MAG: dihydrolipoamide acetyltransferase family protein [Haloarculaceae archaeon]